MPDPEVDARAKIAGIADILAAGLTRLVGVKSRSISAASGESSVGFGPQPSGDAPTCSLGVDV
jgi:hypothetical protein